MNLDPIIFLFITGILLSCFVASLAVFRFFYKRQKQEHEQIIREQYRDMLDFASNIAGEQLHQNVINRQIRPIFKQLRQLKQQVDVPTQIAIQKIIAQLEIAENKVRNVSNEIYPPHLTEMFLPTCQNTVMTLAKAHSYKGKVDFRHEGSFDGLEDLLMFGLYSVIDLFVSNSLNHAEASEILVEIKRIGDRIFLKMSDNGKGFDMNAVKKMDSRGIGDFKKRAISIAISASKFDYYSVLNKGTFFEMEVIIQPKKS
jgi:signal transduction histidine kinase